MLELEFSVQDVALTRFAFSPLWEVVASVRVLKDPSAHALHLPWVNRVRPRLSDSPVDLRVLTDLVPVPGRTLPGFLAPTPVTAAPELAAELAGLRAGTLDRLATAVEAYWEIAIAPFWSRIRDLLEGDIRHRARILAEGGAERLLNDLDPAIRWADGTLTIRHPLLSESRDLRGRGLVLVPSAFIWPRVASKTSEPWQPVLRYPARGVATLWERRSAGPPDGLARALGRTRAQLLAELGSPASTSELARRTGVTAGGVSQHLSALRAAGLVTAHRTGRSVLYSRTEVGDALVPPDPPEPGESSGR